MEYSFPIYWFQRIMLPSRYEWKLFQFNFVGYCSSHYYYINMNVQNNQDDSMNFSIIDKKEQKRAQLDFSVQSLLENNDSVAKIKQDSSDPQTVLKNVFSKIKQIQQNTSKIVNVPPLTKSDQCSQQFLKDLSRMEKELSFEAESYDIYQDNHNNSIEVKQGNKSKTLSYLKVTKEFTNKSISKESLQDFNDYYGDLIIDFHKKEGKNKEKNINKTQSKNASNNLSSQSSIISKSKNKKTANGSKDLKIFYRLKDLKSPQKKKIVHESKKSKSKSLSHKLSLRNSKSHSHLKTSTAETFEEKVFTQYYGTEINLNYPKAKDGKKKEDPRSALLSKDKSPKTKPGILSPRTKHVQKVTSKKVK